MTLVFEGVSEVFLNYFNEQNAIDGLLVDETDEGKKLLIEPIYGLQGDAMFESVRVQSAEAYDP